MQKSAKKPRFSYEELRIAATSLNAKIRKKMFEDYFEMFEEFPSYLFDNSNGIDRLLSETIQDIENDPSTSEKMRKGITVLLQRIPSSA